MTNVDPSLHVVGSCQRRVHRGRHRLAQLGQVCALRLLPPTSSRVVDKPTRAGRHHWPFRAHLRQPTADQPLDRRIARRALQTQQIHSQDPTDP